MRLAYRLFDEHDKCLRKMRGDDVDCFYNNIIYKKEKFNICNFCSKNNNYHIFPDQEIQFTSESPGR